MIRTMYFLIWCMMFLLFACQSKKKADTLFIHATIHPIDSSGITYEAMVVSDGKIVALGTVASCKEQYDATQIVDLKGKHIYPGWHDAHCHFWGYGITLQEVDLTGAKTWDEVVERCVRFYQTHKPSVLKGRGWDQNVWPSKTYPDNTLLNRHFPNIPVLLKRVDGHAAIANSFLLKQAGVDLHTTIAGGEYIRKGKQLTGVLIDNAVDMVSKVLSEPDRATHVRALLAARDSCLAYGITALTDAGLPTSTILIMDSLQQAGVLPIRINAMVSIQPSEVAYWIKRGVYQTPFLRVGSFKLYADGALGSRGACLLSPYHDAIHHGMLITDVEVMKNYIQQVANSPFQLNTHCIGDSANRTLLRMYADALGPKNDKRWRIEHAQVMHPEDFAYYKTYHIIPSIQPTHATSDMYWAEDRLGIERLAYAYAYQTLLQQNGYIALGTDFPVEHINPMYTLYAAVVRKDKTGFPSNGFMPQEGLTFWQTLYGMTVWAAYAAFGENLYGNIKPGLYADFVVYDTPILPSQPTQWLHMRPSAVYVHGISRLKNTSH